MGARAGLAVFLLLVAPVKAAEGNVEFWREDITLTCPNKGTWFINGKEVLETKDAASAEYTMKNDGKMNNVHYCQYDEDVDGISSTVKYYFYAKGKSCKDCFELDGKLFLLVIVVDVIGTAAVMMIIYRCTKKKGSGASAQPRTPSRSGPAPPTPSRDYEQLNVHTRSQDTYSIVNRTG